MLAGLSLVETTRGGAGVTRGVEAALFEQIVQFVDLALVDSVEPGSKAVEDKRLDAADALQFSDL